MQLRSLTVHHTVAHTLYGAFLVLAGIFILTFKLVDGGEVFGFLSIVALVLCFVCLVYVLFARPEKSDEMSKAHLQEAYAKAYRIERAMLLALMAFGSLSRLLGWNFVNSFDAILPFLVGIGEFVIGTKFYKLEKDGE